LRGGETTEKIELAKGTRSGEKSVGGEKVLVAAICPAGRGKDWEKYLRLRPTQRQRTTQ